MLTLLLIIIGFIAGSCFAIDSLEPPRTKKGERKNIKKLVIGGLIGAILFPLCFML